MLRELNEIATSARKGPPRNDRGLLTLWVGRAGIGAPNITIIPNPTSPVNGFCTSAALICVLYKYVLWILYNIAYCIFLILVLFYRCKEVIPMYR